MSATPWVITPQELIEKLAQKPADLVLLDVREPEEYVDEHLAGCKLIPLDDLLTRAPTELDPKSEIIVYCAHGVRSMHGMMALKQLGYKRLRSLEGGIAAWMEAGGSVER